MEEKSIEKIVQNGLESSTVDLAVDYSELALDSFLDNEAVKELPIVKTIVGLVNGGLKVREIFFVKKLLTFLKEFHSGKLSDEKRKEFIEKFNQDEKYKNSVIEQIMILNERFLEVEKSKILANLFSSHLNGKIGWEIFCDLSACLDKLHLKGLLILRESAESKNPFYMVTDPNRPDEGLLSSAGFIISWGNQYYINAYGQHLYYYGVVGDIEFDFARANEERKNK